MSQILEKDNDYVVFTLAVNPFIMGTSVEHPFLLNM